MTESELHQKLAMFADGELEGDARAQVEALVQRDPQAATEVERWKGLRRCACRVVRTSSVPAHLEQRLRLRLRKPRVRRPIPFFRLTGIAGGIAAAILATFMILPDFDWSSRPRVVSAALTQPATPVTLDAFAQTFHRCALGRHDQFGLRSASIDQIAAKLASAGQNRSTLPDLTDDGFMLDGVCSCFGTDRVHAVHAFYRSTDDPSKVLSFFATDRRVQLPASGYECSGYKSRHYTVARGDGVSLLKWDTGPSSFALCGEIDSDLLHSIAEGVAVAGDFTSGPAVAHSGPP